MQVKNNCEKHKEPLKLFCEDDHTAICLVCRESREHKWHNVQPIEEADEEYKSIFKNLLDPLRMELETSVIKRSDEEYCFNNIKSKLKTERTKVVEDIKLLHQRLKEEELTILQRIDNMVKKVSLCENANISKLSDKISSFGKMIDEIEMKRRQPADDFLKDVHSILSRCSNMTFQNQEAQMKINNGLAGTSFAQAGSQIEDGRNSLSKSDVNQMKRNLAFSENEAQVKKAKMADKEFETGSGNVTKMNRADMKKYKVDVTLDQNTASPWLVLKGRRVMNKGIEKEQSENPRRFLVHRCVLGCVGFSSGIHYWEVEVVKVGDGWCMGVAGESVKRNKRITQCPQEAVWAVGRKRGKYVAFTSPEITLTQTEIINKVGVYLDYENGELSLYNVKTEELLHTFKYAFKEKIFPYFNIKYRSELRM